MTIFIAMLRGINVGGTRKAPMEALRQMFVDRGFSKVQTYIQSGNVIFHDTKKSVKKIESLIGGAIAKKFGEQSMNWFPSRKNRLNRGEEVRSYIREPKFFLTTFYQKKDPWVLTLLLRKRIRCI